MNLLETALLAWHFGRTRWGLQFGSRAALEAFQKKRIAKFIKQELPRAPFYRPFANRALADLPVIDKSVMLAHFGGMNAAGITLEQATTAAMQGETTRDFSASLKGITVGLSSGTQGPRGVFLAAPRERAKWAGIMLARVLPGDMLRQLVFSRTPIHVAFFLRANSNLYTTLNSRRIDFRFYDLIAGLDVHLAALARHQPDILVAPARILGAIAALVLEGRLAIRPRKVIAVAEVLEPDDRARIAGAFGLVVHQLYQCTEGFLGYTCEEGTLHLNEEFVHFEKEWIDESKTRFIPVVTDFSRNTQLIVRYRLNDILRVATVPCPCGGVTTALAAIDGRSDDILYIGGTAVFPDLVRHAIATAPRALPDYRIEQHGDTLRIAVADGKSFGEIAAALTALCKRLGLVPPSFEQMDYLETQAHLKRRRIVCAARGQERARA